MTKKILALSLFSLAVITPFSFADPAVAAPAAVRSAQIKKHNHASGHKSAKRHRKRKHRRKP